VPLQGRPGLSAFALLALAGDELRKGAGRTPAHPPLYGADGCVVAGEVLGDGIGHVLADTAGHIWAGYSDEGIYGNYGWGRSDSAEPLGSHGLVRWALDLRSRWCHPGMASGFRFINDCYALNVNGTTVWACCDAEFPVLRIHDGEISAWRNEVRGAGSVAVDGTTAALLGGRGRITVVQLIAGRFRPASEYRVMLPNGSSLPEHTQIVGRGPMLPSSPTITGISSTSAISQQRRDDDNLGSRTEWLVFLPECTTSVAISAPGNGPCQAQSPLTGPGPICRLDDRLLEGEQWPTCAAALSAAPHQRQTPRED
jgi:hypothetical protein